MRNRTGRISASSTAAAPRSARYLRAPPTVSPLGALDLAAQRRDDADDDGRDQRDHQAVLHGGRAAVLLQLHQPDLKLGDELEHVGCPFGCVSVPAPPDRGGGPPPPVTNTLRYRCLRRHRANGQKGGGRPDRPVTRSAVGGGDDYSPSRSRDSVPPKPYGCPRARGMGAGRRSEERRVG